MRTPRLSALLLASGLAPCLAAGALCLAPPSPAWAEEELGAVLEGFEEDSSDDVEDVLGGFEDEESAADARAGETDDAGPERGRRWSLTGGARLGASYNVRPHRSSSGTYYGNLQRLSLKTDLQLDVDLPADWKFRAQGYGFYDFAYVIHGRGEYTQDVLDTHEWEFDYQDLYVEGALGRAIDVKLGRQVVNWGRSDNLRVTDVLNPLDNREPGLTDIEDLRRPVTMLRIDAYRGAWSATAILIPEIRYDYIPAFGSDFFPAVDPGTDIPLPPGVSPALAAPLLSGFDANALGDLPDLSTAQWGSTPEYAAALDGVFSGWDISFYAARIVQNQSTVLLDLSGPTAAAWLGDDRVTMLGSGGNYTRGSWLFKAELAYLNGLAYTVLEPDLSLCPDPASLPAGTRIPYRTPRIEKSRLDVMGGVEYYGFSDTTIALEIANRHVFDYEANMGLLPSYAVEASVECALRVSSDWMNARLHLTALGLVFGERAQHGAILRLSADYDLRDALVLGGGLLYFFEGDLPPLDGWRDNDRLFLSLDYSF